MLLSSKIIKQVYTELEDIPVYPRSALGQEKSDTHLLIKAKEKEIDAVLKSAHIQADKLLKESEKRIAAMEQEAYDKGYLKGKEDGWHAGKNEADKIYESARKVLQQAEDIRQKVFRNTEEELVELAIEIAEKLVCRQLDLNPDTVMDIARSAYLQVMDCQQVIIYVAPEQVEILEARKQEIGTQLYSTKRLQIIGDPNIKSGGCRVETEQGYIDATVPAMLKQLESVIKGNV